MLDRRFDKLWERLRARKKHMPHFLEEIRLQGIRGIDDIRVGFDYPVSVLAGENASGKSTVLFAAACAYRVPGAGVRDFVPSTLFPDYRPRNDPGGRADRRSEIRIEFDYATPDGRRAMRWRRTKGWNRSFLGRENGSQPERPVYLRTLTNLGNPSEVRGVLGMSQTNAPPEETPLTASQVAFAQRMLPFRYAEVVHLSSGARNLLVAAQEGGASYSELHMAAGERAILRLAREIAQIEGALVLIDEVEAGLHPWVQRLLMLHLQELALRNDLQIIVTTHSPVVLDAVDSLGRIFLERDDTGRVAVRSAYRDVVQNALYGRADNAISLLCEDEAAEGILLGVFDVLLPRERIAPECVRIGRDTGADEFPAHAAAFRKFGQLGNFVFVLDGDQRGRGVDERIRARAGSEVPVLFLPGAEGPESWIWGVVGREPAGAAPELGVSADDLAARMTRLDAIYAAAVDRPGEIAKFKLRDLVEPLGWSAADLGRLVARREASRKKSDIQPLVEALQGALLRWRAA